MTPRFRPESLFAYIDLLGCALVGFVAFAILMVIPNEKTSSEVNEPGNFAVEIRWPDELDVDVDLWVKAPGDRPVGYSNKSGNIFDLLRDDLGASIDALGLNYENAYSRGAPDGEWIVNLHYYNAKGHAGAVAVAVQVTQKRGRDRVVVWAGNASLAAHGTEVTVLRFSVADGNVTAKAAPTFLTKIRSNPNQAYGMGTP